MRFFCLFEWRTRWQRMMRPERGITPFLTAFLAFLGGLTLVFAPGFAQTAKNGASFALSSDSVIIGRGVHLVEDQGADTAALVVDLSDETTFRFEVLTGPDRLVIDLDRVVFAANATRVSGKAIGPVSGFRAGLFLTGQSRIVVDLARPALVERGDYVRQGGVARLVLQMRGTNAERFAEQARTDSAKRQARRASSITPVPPRADGKPLIVIDPGHGGIDPGASGLKGEAEKDIVLAYGKALRERLLRSGAVAVEMTRDDDRFIALNERVSFARSRNAALFVSLHADTLLGEGDVRGASVYTVSDRASDAQAARAAEKENRADLLAGLEQDEEARDGVDSILVDLARRETRVFTQVAARDAASAIRAAGRLHKTPMRSAGFRVLRAPDMPSLLIELGYLSNAEDLAAMTDPATRQKLAESLGDAMEKFVLAARSGATSLALPANPPEEKPQ